MIDFYYPNRLWFALLALIPVIIHIINFRKHKKVLFSNVYLLKQLEKDTRNIRRLKDILLMLVRSLAILLLAIAFAGPYISYGTRKKAHGNNKISFFIDNSFSMQLQNQNGILLDYAKTVAKNIINQTYNGKTFDLITCDKYLTNLSQEEALREIDKIRLSSSSFEIANLQNLLHKHHTDKVYILSDMQKNFASNCTPDSTIDYTLIPFIPSTKGNLVLDTCFLANPENTTSNALIFKVTNHSSKAVTDLPVRLELNGAMKNIKTLTVESGETVTDTIIYEYTGQDDFLKGKLSFDDYPVTFDNTLYFSYKLKKEYKIAIVDDSENHAVEKYVKAAFTASENNGQNKFKAAWVPVATLIQENTPNYDAIFIGNLKSVPPDFASRITEWLEAGITVVYFSGTADYKQSAEILKQVAGWEVQGLDTSSQEIKSVLFEDPVFRNSIVKPKKKTKYPIIDNIQIVQTSSAKATHLIVTEKDLPVVLYYSAYPARFFVLTADISGNKAFYYSPLFFVTVYNAVVKSEITGPVYRYCSKPYMIELPFALSYDRTVSIRLLGENRELIPYQQNNGNTVKVFLSETDIPVEGFYDFHADTLHYLMAFSYNRKESRFEYEPPEKLVQYLGNKGNITVIHHPENVVYEITHGGEQELWKVLVAFSLFMLLFEIVLLKLYGKKKK